MDDLIIVKQLPIIEERLKELSSEIDQKVNDAVSLVCTEETVKSVKAIRAELSRDFLSLEDQRKAVKTAVMTPYEQFENVYKEYVSNKFKQADAMLKGRIDDVEGELKKQRQRDVKAYFDEYLLSKHIDFITFDNARINVTLTASMKSLKEQAKAFVDRICNDLALIDTQEYKTEILVEYKKTLNCSQAITSVKARFEAIEREKQRKTELKTRIAAETETVKRVEAIVPSPLAPPKIKEVKFDLYKTLYFKVSAPISKLRELKKFLDDNGYQYE